MLLLDEIASVCCLRVEVLQMVKAQLSVRSTWIVGWVLNGQPRNKLV